MNPIWQRERSLSSLSSQPMLFVHSKWSRLPMILLLCQAMYVSLQITVILDVTAARCFQGLPAAFTASGAACFYIEGPKGAALALPSGFQPS